LDATANAGGEGRTQDALEPLKHEYLCVALIRGCRRLAEFSFDDRRNRACTSVLKFPRVHELERLRLFADGWVGCKPNL
jgi:hypothetical protein